MNGTPFVSLTSPYYLPLPYSRPSVGKEGESRAARLKHNIESCVFPLLYIRPGTGIRFVHAEFEIGAELARPIGRPGLRVRMAGARLGGRRQGEGFRKTPRLRLFAPGSYPPISI